MGFPVFNLNRKRRIWENKELLCSDFEIYTHMPCLLQRSSSLLLTGELSYELTEYNFFPWGISEQWNRFSTTAQQLEANLTVTFLELFQIAPLFNLCGLHISFGLKGWSGGHEAYCLKNGSKKVHRDICWVPWCKFSHLGWFQDTHLR